MWPSCHLQFRLTNTDTFYPQRPNLLQHSPVTAFANLWWKTFHEDKTLPGSKIGSWHRPRTTLGLFSSVLQVLEALRILTHFSSQQAKTYVLQEPQLVWPTQVGPQGQSSVAAQMPSECLQALTWWLYFGSFLCKLCKKAVKAYSKVCLCLLFKFLPPHPLLAWDFGFAGVTIFFLLKIFLWWNGYLYISL